MPRKATDAPLNSVKVGDFTYANGDRRCVAAYNGGDLMVRCMTHDGQSVAMNLDAEGAHKMGAVLCRYLELAKLNKEDIG